MKTQTIYSLALVRKAANEVQARDFLLDNARDIQIGSSVWRRITNHVKLVFSALPEEKRKIITKKHGEIDEIIKKSTISTNNGEIEILLNYDTQISKIAGQNRDFIFLKYAMDGNRITEIDAITGKGRAESHASSAPAPPRANEVGTAPPRTTKSQPGRANRVQLGTWIDPAYKHNLLMVRAKAPANRTAESLVEEALNDLFRKYDVPTLPLSEYRRPGPKRSLGN